MKPLHEYPLTELKLVYRVLHAQIAQHPDLMDAELLEDLQGWLQIAAKKDGVNATEHAEWDTWLGNTAIPCELRMQGRRRIEPV